MRLTVACLILCTTASACWRDQARPTLPSQRTASQPQLVTDEPKPERDYRVATVAIDAAGVGAMVAGLVLVHQDSRTTAGGALIDGGLVVAGFGSIVTHVVMGRTDRAWRRYLIQGGLVLAGGISGSLVACGDHNDLGCAIEGMVGGSAAGLAVAGGIDALVLQAPEHPVVPTLSVTEGGARVGLGGSF